MKIPKWFWPIIVIELTRFAAEHTSKNRRVNKRVRRAAEVVHNALEWVG